jgi:hypothetical protein
MPLLTRHTGAAALAVPLTILFTMTLTAAQAAPLRVSASGVFDGSAPSSFFTAPGATWSFSFVIDSNPVPLTDPPSLTESGQFTTVPFTEFVYRLDGLAIAEAPSFTSFYNNVTNSGGLDIVFNDFVADPGSAYQALNLFGPQVYSGDEFTPTFLPGTYDTYLPGFASSFFVYVDGVGYGQGDTTIVITAVPAPAPLLLSASALLLLGLASRRPSSKAVAAVAH